MSSSYQIAGLVSALCTAMTEETKAAAARAVIPVALALHAGVKRATPPPRRVDRVSDRVMSEDAALKTLGKRRFGRLANSGMLRMSQQGNQRVVRMANKRGPTGQLKNAWLLEPSGDGTFAEVFNTRQYAPFVNYGTGRRGAAAAHAALPPDYAHGAGAGMAAQDMTTEPTARAEADLARRLESELGSVGEKVLS